mmetsp:Transcript_19332/g.39755  ORF Transcript_19332/g.39755 Transcript_19332/m.39755 type:complete len:85 (-) Transcript_19332:1254-1508(-)
MYSQFSGFINQESLLPSKQRTTLNNRKHDNPINIDEMHLPSEREHDITLIECINECHSTSPGEFLYKTKTSPQKKYQGAHIFSE